MAEKQWKIMEGAIYDQGKTKYSGGREKKLNRGREIDASTGKKYCEIRHSARKE